MGLIVYVSWTLFSSLFSSGSWLHCNTMLLVVVSRNHGILWYLPQVLLVLSFRGLTPALRFLPRSGIFGLFPRCDRRLFLWLSCICLLVFRIFRLSVVVRTFFSLWVQQRDSHSIWQFYLHCRCRHVCTSHWLSVTLSCGFQFWSVRVVAGDPLLWLQIESFLWFYGFCRFYYEGFLRDRCPCFCCYSFGFLLFGRWVFPVSTDHFPVSKLRGISEFFWFVFVVVCFPQFSWFLVFPRRVSFSSGVSLPPCMLLRWAPWTFLVFVSILSSDVLVSLVRWWSILHFLRPVFSLRNSCIFCNTKSAVDLVRWSKFSHCTESCNNTWGPLQLVLICIRYLSFVGGLDTPCSINGRFEKII